MNEVAEESDECLLCDMMDFIEYKSIERAKRRNEFASPDTFHVSDLIYCRRKQMMMREHPEMSAQVTVKPAVFNGIVFETGLRQYARDYFKTTAYIPEFSYHGKKMIGKYTVIGEADIVLFNGWGNCGKVDTVIDIKNRIFDTKWKESYVLQIMLYKWLFNAENIMLWCFSSAAKQKEWRVTNKSLDDKTVLDMIEHPKQPVWDWECEYCSFKKDCPYREKKRFG